MELYAVDTRKFNVKACKHTYIKVQYISADVFLKATSSATRADLLYDMKL